MSLYSRERSKGVGNHLGSDRYLVKRGFNTIRNARSLPVNTIPYLQRSVLPHAKSITLSNNYYTVPISNKKMSRILEPLKRKTSRVTRKGQITIPARFRQENGIKEGSSVEITEVGSKLIVEPVPDLLDLVGCDRGRYDQTKLKKMLDESRKNWR